MSGQPGVAVLLHQLADRLDTQPSRPADLHTIRGHGRALGLTEDQLAFLPATDGDHQSAYAARLRHLAGPVAS